jgi:hypothetical protein
MSRITKPFSFLASTSWCHFLIFLWREIMPPERGLLSVLYEGLFLALAHRLAAQ